VQVCASLRRIRWWGGTSRPNTAPARPRAGGAAGGRRGGHGAGTAGSTAWRVGSHPAARESAHDVGHDAAAASCCWAGRDRPASPMPPAYVTPHPNTPGGVSRSPASVKHGAYGCGTCYDLLHSTCDYLRCASSTSIRRRMRFGRGRPSSRAHACNFTNCSCVKRMFCRMAY
jgi:hypothetical protein